MNKMSREKEIFNYLYDLGCCKPCCLRYVCVRHPDIYSDVDKYILEKKFVVDDSLSDQLTPKKLKTNACIVCLGLLQDHCVHETIEKVSNDEKIKSFDSSVFTCSVSFPMCVQVREHSVRLELDKQFPDFYTEEIMETQLNKAWKWTVKDRLAEKLNRTFESSETCDFSINITMSYEFDIEELGVLHKMQPTLFETRQIQHRKFRGEVFSRKGVQTALSQTRPGIFREHGTVPPTIPTKALTCAGIDCIHTSIYLAGRYCKFSRELSQTPWIINGVKTMETSLQEILFEPFHKILNIPDNGMKFSASGREDVDVRCLGRGRPFVIEYLNPKKTKIAFDEFRRLENDVNLSHMIHITDLQLVPRKELVHIKTGEESKTKDYEALCTCKIPVTQEMLDKMNAMAPLEIQQKTPIRVLHRRPLAVRKRTIHAMHTEFIPGHANLFKLKITTQAGTYVKEFVHGDFERTKPSVESILPNCEIDIIALDVTAINLDWPTPIIYT